MSLLQLIAEFELSRMTLIEDSPLVPTRELIVRIIKNSVLRENRNVHVICDEIPTSFYTEHECLQEYSDRMTIYDMFSDPCCWNDTSTTKHITHKILNYSEDISKVAACTNGSCSNCVYILDSLSQILLHQSIGKASRMIEKIIRQHGSGHGVAVICILHPELHDPFVTQNLKHQATAVLSLIRTSSIDFRCDYIFKKLSGKIMESSKYFQLNDEFGLENVTEVTNPTEPSKPDIDDEKDVMVNLTFNLSLKPNEEEARKKLVLPFMKANDKKEPKIEYQPDDADDYDDEDPDDDLDL